MSLIITLLTSLALVGQTPPPAERQGFKNDPPPPTDSFKPDPSWKPLGKDSKEIWFDPKGKRLVIRGKVALQEGALEHLLCKKNSKEHESVLVTEAPPQMIQAGLLLTGAEVGHPVRYEPKFEPPAGTAIAIEVEWEVGGKWMKADARDWVKDQASGKPLTQDWVFAGSQLFQDQRTKAMLFAADDGDLFTVANFPAAILDLPFRSSDSDKDRSYVANADRVPVRGTPVTIYLQPRAAFPAEKGKPQVPAVR